MAGGDTLAQAVAVEYTPRFRATLVEFGMPIVLTTLVSLRWNGTTYEAYATAGPNQRRIEAYESGDGKNPVQAPVRKALNRMQPVLHNALRARIEAGVGDLVLDGVMF